MRPKRNRLSTCVATALSLLLATMSATAQQQSLLSPSGTFLNTDPLDPASPPTVLNLAQLGLRPGDHLSIRTVGDFEWHRDQTQPLMGQNAVAVFSSSTTVLPSTQRHRVPGAIQSSAPPYVTGPTYQTNLATDIPEDFWITPAGLTVVIPDAGGGVAPFLLIGADDVFWSDNVDAENDFGVEFGPVYPLDTELLFNGDFELGSTAGWTATNGTFQVSQYSGPTTPSAAVAARVGGGSLLAQSLSAPGFYAAMVQRFDLSGHAAAIDAGQRFVELEGYFGGFASSDDFSVMTATFLDVNGGRLSVPFVNSSVGSILVTNRNAETTMMRRRGVFQLPIGTRRLEIELRGNYRGFGPTTALADNLSAQLRASAASTPLPIDAELLDDPGFESGDLINPVSTTGWTVTQGRFQLSPYGAPTTPGTSVSVLIQGGSLLLDAVDAPNYSATVEQRFDLRGNASAVDSGQMFVELSGYFGGLGGKDDSTSLTALYFSSNGGSLGVPFVTPTIGIVPNVRRNGETTLMRCTGRFPIPTGTRTMAIELRALYAGFSTVDGLADNLSARLRLSPGFAPLPIGTELLGNGGFESGDIIDPTSATGWAGLQGQVTLPPYGSPGAPPVSVSTQIGGGARLCTSHNMPNYLCEFEQSFDLRGNAAAIDLGNLGIRLSGWFGGAGTLTDDSYLEARYFTEFLGTLGSSSVGFVAPAERANSTDLRFRSGDSTIPVGTRFLSLRLGFRASGIGNGSGLADNLSATLLDLATTPVLPGTGDDLELLTGVNGPVSGGPHADIKSTLPGDILDVHIASSGGSLRGAPLLFGVQLLATGTSIPGILPGIHLNPAFPGLFVLLDPAIPIGGLGTPQVVPGGISARFAIPGGLGGYDMRLQAIALSPFAANSIYAATDAHLIHFQ